MKKKLDLDKFRVAKLSNSRSIIGGNDTDGTDTVTTEKPKCIQTSRIMIEE